MMIDVKIKIERVIDESYPVFVEARLVDCNGNAHYFHDKLPVFTKAEPENIPCDGIVRCEMITENADTVLIDTLTLDDIESLNGVSRFEICKDQIVYE